MARNYSDELRKLNSEFVRSVISVYNEFPTKNFKEIFIDYETKLEALKRQPLQEKEKNETDDTTTGYAFTDSTLNSIATIGQELNLLNINGCQDEIIQTKKPHISWHEYFMSVALLAARRSKDPNTQVGACIVNKQNKIIGTGYNGMPRGISDDSVPWTKEGSFLETKYAYVVHAELNAILNCVLTDQTGCRIYVSLFPCNECTKAIIQSGIEHVIYLSDKHRDKDSTKAAKRMLQMTGIRLDQYQNLNTSS